MTEEAPFAFPPVQRCRARDRRTNISPHDRFTAMIMLDNDQKRASVALSFVSFECIRKRLHRSPREVDAESTQVDTRLRMGEPRPKTVQRLGRSSQGSRGPLQQQWPKTHSHRIITAQNQTAPHTKPSAQWPPTTTWCGARQGAGGFPSRAPHQFTYRSPRRALASGTQPGAPPASS